MTLGSMIDVVKNKVDMEGAATFASVLEKETPKKRGRPKKVLQFNLIGLNFWN